MARCKPDPEVSWAVRGRESTMAHPRGTGKGECRGQRLTSGHWLRFVICVYVCACTHTPTHTRGVVM